MEIGCSITIYKNENKLETDNFYKENDSRRVRPNNSAHTNHVLNNIPFGLAARVHKIISIDENTIARLEDLKKSLIKQ